MGGGENLGGLLFADDLVLLAESGADLKRLVTATNDFMTGRRLSRDKCSQISSHENNPKSGPGT